MKKFLDMVPRLALLAVSEKPKQENWEQHWAFGTGKSWKSLKAFPDRMRSIADEVDQLNRSSFFNPEVWISPETDMSDMPISLLPKFLRRYAGWMEIQAREIVNRFNFKPTRNRYSPWVLKLSNHVEMTLGRFCDAEVAEILNAAARVLNPKLHSADKGFDAKTLSNLRSSRSKAI
jgi:hypothetical protein